MATITFTIPAGKLKRVTDSIKGLHSIPQDQNGDPQFTDNEWAKEYIRRHIRDMDYRWRKKAEVSAIEHDNDIAS